MKRIVIFDFDNVIIRGQSQLYLVKYLFKQKKIKFFLALQIFFWFFLKKLGLHISPSRIRNIAYKTFTGWTVEYFDDFFRKFKIEVVQRYYISGTQQLINSYLDNRDEVIIVSATLKKIVENCLPDLKIEHCIATELEVIDNRYTGAVKGVVPFSYEKCLVIKEYLENRKSRWGSCVALTDDYSDLELLNRVGFPFIINPDNKLREIAIKRGWKIYDF